MEKPYVNIAETCLDMASFFLVTTDLYGEKRLRELGERLRHSSLTFDQVSMPVWFAFVGAGYWIFFRYYEAHVAWFKQNFALVSALIQDGTGFVMIILLVVSLPFTWLVLRISSWFSRGAAFVIDKWQMKGALIAFGSILFVAARLVSLFESLEAH